MTNVLVDNWTLEKASPALRNPNLSSISVEYVKLIEAFVLWDKIYYIDSPFSTKWKSALASQNYSLLLSPISEKYCSTTPVSASLLQSLTSSFSLPAPRTFEYQILCNILGLHYLPSNERIQFLNHYRATENFYNREDIISYLDKEVLEYYSSIVARFSTNKLSFKFPILFDYIKHCSNGSISFEAINQLHNAKEIQNFRTWMNTVENQIENGNILALDQTLRLISDVINDITHLIQSDNAATFEISLTPSISIPINFKKYFNLIKNRQQKIHTDFLRTLTDYALTRRQE
ncbi:hypothetical protein [Gemmiger formicilis]|uniref:hypothetical protein n=1 Tax=Gemmiger formicilis TaxID=745368 RepID=UPI0035205823